MKRPLILIILLSSILTASSQNSSFLSYPLVNGRITFIETVKIDMPRSKLFNNARKFLLNQDFYGPSKIICKNGRKLNQPIISRRTDIMDSINGKIGGKGFYIVNYGRDNNFTLNFDYSIEVRDSVFRYKLTNFYVYEYRSVPKYASRIDNLGYSFDKILKDGNIDVYKLEEFRLKIQFLSSTNPAIMSHIENFCRSINETMSGTKTVKWE